MVRVLKIVSGGFVPLAVGVWIGIVGIKAQVDNVVDYWPYPWLWALAGAALVCSAVWLVLMLSDGSFRGKPDFVLEKENGWWFLKRTRKRTAYKLSIIGTDDLHFKSGQDRHVGQTELVYEEMIGIDVWENRSLLSISWWDRIGLAAAVNKIPGATRYEVRSPRPDGRRDKRLAKRRAERPPANLPQY